ncbi:MAG: DUF2461 domain-containing protein [Pseudomonadota bacterium]
MSSAPVFSSAAFEFLPDLEANNNREWFNANKPRFQDLLERPFIALLEALSNRLVDAKRPIYGGKQTLFRMNRDTRFSDDKSPYKTNLSGVLTPSGTKSESTGLLYIQLGAAGGFSVSGYYNLSPKQLGPMRDAMIEQPARFESVLKSLSDSGRAFDTSMSLSSMPKGFTEHGDHPFADYIKLKSLMVREDLPKAAWLDGSCVDILEGLARDTMELLSFTQPGR